MLPTMPPLIDYAEFSCKEFNDLSNIEKAIFSSFLENVYDEPKAKKLDWAANHSGEIMEAFYGSLAEVPKWVILVDGEFAGFWLGKQYDDKHVAMEVFIAPIFCGNALYTVLGEIARRVATENKLNVVSVSKLNKPIQNNMLKKLFGNIPSEEVLDSATNQPVHLYKYDTLAPVEGFPHLENLCANIVTAYHK